MYSVEKTLVLHLRGNKKKKILDTKSVDDVQNASLAIQNKDVKALLKMLKKGLDPNVFMINGDTLLHFAIRCEKPEMVDLLLKYNANPNARSVAPMMFSLKNQLTEYTGENFILTHTTPLMTALNFESTHDDSLEIAKKMINSLLEKGACVNDTECTFSLAPIHLAANQLEPSLITLLANHGANPNAIAFPDGISGISTFFNSKITPLLLATNPTNISRSAETINTLVLNGALLNTHNQVSFQYSLMLFLLHQQNPKKASSILHAQLHDDFKKMQPQTVEKTLDAFLKTPDKTEQVIDFYVEKLLRKDADVKNQYNDIKYFAHLNSWNGDLAKKDFDPKQMEEDPNHTIQESEGWFADSQIPKKIKNYLYILEGVADGKIDCPHKFNESTASILKKIRSEIHHQVTTFFTCSHIEYANRIPKPHSIIPTADSKLSTPLWYFEDAPDLKRDIEKTLVANWSNRISKLKPNESFCTYLGTSDHATYLEFKKQKNGNITRIIYNLGTGIVNHPHTLDGKVYPHVAKNIPAHFFQNSNVKGLSYLLTIINTGKFPSFHPKKQNLHPAFKAVYNGVYPLEASPADSKDLLYYVPMKQQVVGNCSVKNNLCAIRNRLSNDNLYKFLKNYEVLSIKESMHIGSRLIKEKEFQKDIDFLDMVVTSKGDFAKAAEQDLFEFFKKRAFHTNQAPHLPAGERLAHVIQTLRKSDLMDEYFSHLPYLFYTMNEIADFYDSNSLKEIVDKYSKRYEISSKILDHNANRLKLSRNFHLIASSGQNIISSEFSGEKREINKRETAPQKASEPSIVPGEGKKIEVSLHPKNKPIKKRKMTYAPLESKSQTKKRPRKASTLNDSLHP
jgi:ankyrin repeat protein